MKNVALRIMGDLVIGVYGAEKPTDEEIEDSLKLFDKFDPSRVRSLIVSNGGSPTPLQRKLMLDALGGKVHLSAIVSDAVKVRGAVTALSWFNNKVKAFPTAKFNDALTYLSVPPAQFEIIAKEVKRLQAEIGVT